MRPHRGSPHNQVPRLADRSAGRRVRERFSNLQVGVVVLIVLTPLVYLAFTKHVPYTHGFRFKAVFSSAVDIRPRAPVRIAGVSVGQVDSVEAYPHSRAALVTIEMRKGGLPLHRDATLKIRPRLFLEGNFFVDVQPGTPSAPLLKENGTIPLAQTADPVQIDQVLSSLTGDTRTNLQRFLAGYGESLTTGDAAAALNRSYRNGGPALRGVAIVDQALQGTDPRNDVPRLVEGLQRATAGLGQDEAALQGFVSNLDTTLGAFADRSAQLRQAIALLPGTLAHARAGFAALAQALPPARRFARGFSAALGQLPATYSPAEAWFSAATALLAPGELGGFARDLRASAGNRQKLIAGQTQVRGHADAIAQCGSKVVLPAANQVVPDGPLTTGRPNYQELWSSFVGLAGAGQNFDGNGYYAHLFSPSGPTIVTSGPSQANGSRNIGR
ncbi:MAG TPA: MlaD family protein, partial [Solirubrobacteraceae bacterium]|nr:MlaD family protein [Solirubrobacteraceae bacterium]